MKVVINACFGGFGLSAESVKWLIAKKSPLIKTYTEDEYGAGSFPSEHLKDVGGGFKAGFVEGVLRKDGIVYTARIGEDEGRAHPDLIAVIEALGDAASGSFSRLRVVEVPDGVDYTIEEYDGNEHIAEKHRTWG